jgi:hypothetical protein
MDVINIKNITLELILFSVVFLVIIFGVYFFIRRYWKEKFIRVLLVITGLLWILVGYMYLKHVVVMRIWAVIGAPYNPLALEEFLSYDVLPIFAIFLTGASFVLYSSVLIKNTSRTPLKAMVKIILYVIIYSMILIKNLWGQVLHYHKKSVNNVIFQDLTLLPHCVIESHCH